MTEDTEVIEGTETPLEQDDSLSATELVAVRLGETEEEKPEVEPEVEEQPEPTAEEEPSKDIDLESMSEDELKELGGKLGSKAVSRFGAMTARFKAAEEELQRLKATQGNPLEAPEPEEDNPYANLKTPASLQDKYKEVGEVIEWAEDILEENEDASSGDEVTEVDGKPLTKTEVRQALKRARKAKEKHLPARFHALGAVAQREQFKTRYTEQAKAELPWIGDAESELNVTYEKMLADPRIAAVEKAVPDLGPQLGYILAHAANSMQADGKAQVKPVKTGKPKPKPPANPTSSGAPSSRPDAGRAKQLADLQKRAEETGRPVDFEALRAFQHQNR